MNHAGEIAPLARLARPHVAVITAIEKAHVGHLGSIEAIADEKASILRGLEPGGVAVLPAGHAAVPAAARRCRARRGARVHRRSVPMPRPTCGCSTRDATPTAATSSCDVAGTAAAVPDRRAGPAHGDERAGRAGRRRCRSRRVASARPSARPTRRLAGHGVRADRRARAVRCAPIAGRGGRRRSPSGRRRALLLDESYNGNGASMRAALAVLRAAAGAAAHRGARRHAGTRRRRAGGARRPSRRPVTAAADLLFACGPLMRHLFDAVPERLRAVHSRRLRGAGADRRRARSRRATRSW